MAERIKDLMLAEHGRIEHLLEACTKDFENNFSKLKWNIEKHFFIEEKVVFSIFQTMKGEEIDTVFDLIGEHGKILEFLNELEKKHSKENFENLHRLLTAHKHLENESFYPRLDEELGEVQRAEIIEKIKEIVE